MSSILRTVVAAFATLTLGINAAQAADKQFFGAEYDPAQDQVTHFECDEPYDNKIVPLVVDNPFTYLQPWNGNCTPSALPEADAKRLPCQTSNIKPTIKYHGVQIMGNKWMHRACEEAFKSVSNGGGPFSSVIVQIDDQTGRVIRYWVAHNHVTKWMDPTAHGETTCIRQACKELNVVNLGKIEKANPNLKLPQTGATSHCELYTSAEPCPMCYSASRWAGISKIFFAATVYDAATQGVNFGDEPQYAELSLNYEDRTRLGVNCYQCTTDNSLDAFNHYKRSNSIKY